MNQLLTKETDFLALLLKTSDKQIRALLKTIQLSQLRAIVQIVYNVLLGNINISEKDKKLISNRKSSIRRFVSKGVSFKERKKILLKNDKYIIVILKNVKWREN